MTEQRKSLFLDLGIGFALAASVVSVNWNSGYPLSHLLCDGCFVTAVMLLGAGLLIFCGNHGAFDMINYGVRSVAGLVVHSLEPETDYYTYSRQKREENKPCGHFLIAGAVYLALSGVFMVVYALYN